MGDAGVESSRPECLAAQEEEEIFCMCKGEILGIGIAKDKTNKTGETEWTGITPNAMADRDSVGGLADLLAHAIAINNFGLVDIYDINEKNRTPSAVAEQDVVF